MSDGKHSFLEVQRRAEITTLTVQQVNATNVSIQVLSVTGSVTVFGQSLGSYIESFIDSPPNLTSLTARVQVLESQVSSLTGIIQSLLAAYPLYALDESGHVIRQISLD